jgi:hypothetical protein
MQLSTPVQKFGDVFSCGSGGLGTRSEPIEEGVEVLPGEAPLERLGGGLVVILEAEEAVLESGERVEVVWCEGLSLHDGEVNLDLVEPAGVDGCVDHDQVGPLTGKALEAAGAAVGASVVDYPEHPGGRTIGFLGHHLADQSSEGGDTGLGFASTEDSGLMDVPRSQVGPGSLARVLVFDAHRPSRTCGSDAVFAASGLDAGLLVGADYEIGCSQRTTLPHPLVEIEDSAGLAGEIRVPREDPAAMMPRADGVLREPAPNGRFSNRRHQSPADRRLLDIGHAEPGERETKLLRELTSEGFYGDDDAGGKRRAAYLGAPALRARPGLVRRSVYATC